MPLGCMREETRFLLVLAFLFLLFAEGLSWVTASWPGECIVSPRAKRCSLQSS